MQQPGRMRCAALLLLVLTLCYATQRAAGKTLPVPYPSLDGAPPVKAFDGPAQGPPSGQTYILLYDNKTLESELLDAGRAIEASGGTVVAQHPAIGVAFATSANDSFAANVKAADPRLTHVASTARVQGRGHRKASVDPRRNSGGGSGRGRSVGGGGGGSASKDRARRLLDGKKGAGARPSSELQGDLDAAAAQRRSLSLEPVQAPSLEAVLSSSPPYAAGTTTKDPPAGHPSSPAAPQAEMAAQTEGASPAWGDPLSSEQWDMRATRVPEAHAITTGSRNVTVAIIDTGVDSSHIDLAGQIDTNRSVSCVGGTLSHDPALWKDEDGHGTWCAGCVGAANNGVGTVGVAPGVKLVAIRAADEDGLFLVEAVVCAFMYAGHIRADVASNSFYSDPWLYNCKDDPEQYAIWAAESRAIAYAISKGVTVIGSSGNDNRDLDHPTFDDSSPDDGVPIMRNVTLECPQIPSQVPGVLTVAATGPNGLKAYYSNYGQLFVGNFLRSYTDAANSFGSMESFKDLYSRMIAAPGGDNMYQHSLLQNGGIISTYPSGSHYLSKNGFPTYVNVDTGGATATYVYLQGTSMAAPHVAGVAALAISAAGRRLAPEQVRSILESSAQRVPCPSTNPYMPGGPPRKTGPDAGISTGYEANCTGSPAYNSFYGFGRVDALGAVLMARKLA